MLHRCTACCTSVPPIRFVLVGAVLGKAAATAALQIGASVFYRSHRNWCTVHLHQSYICVRPRVCVGRCVWVGLARTRRGAGEAAKGEFARCDQRSASACACASIGRSLSRATSPTRSSACTARRCAGSTGSTSVASGEGGRALQMQAVPGADVGLRWIHATRARAHGSALVHTRADARCCMRCLHAIACSPGALTHVCLRRPPARPFPSRSPSLRVFTAHWLCA